MKPTLTPILIRSPVLALLLSMFCWNLHSEVLDVGSRLELFVEPSLVEELGGEARLQLQRPIPREAVLVTDRPWEGNACFTFTIFQDGNRYRMYYRGWHFETGKTLEFPRRQVTCYAESLDGIHWYRPQLGLVEFEGSKRNNILMDRLPDGDIIRNFVPFRDPNPAASPGARYKALSWSRLRGLYAWKSADAIHWELMTDRLVITKGYFDSQNLAFWDSYRNEYREYHRDFRPTAENQPRTKGIRDVMTGTSQDFLNWTDPVWLSYRGSADLQLYTNQITPYHRAPHILLGFPNRYIERGWSDSMRALPGLEHRRLRAGISLRYGTALTEGLLMASRDRVHFHRWPEAFIRPGLRPVDNWTYGDNNQNWGLVETRSHIEGAPDEISMYATEGYWVGESLNLRRFTLRLDGFVAASAPMSGGEIITRPIRFQGNRLLLNFSTSAAGSLQVEIQDTNGKPLKGYGLGDCPPTFGDELEREVRWKRGPDVGDLAGRAVRLRFVLKDADLFAFRFASR